MRALVVSVHDVSPLTHANCDKIIEALRGLGVSEGSLLVIPNHHSKAPVRDDAAFRDWISDRVQQGYEPVLHGYYHARTPKPTDAGITKFTTQSTPPVKANSSISIEMKPFPVSKWE
jgi:uncharacterized protein